MSESGAGSPEGRSPEPDDVRDESPKTPKKVKRESPLQAARRFVLEQGGFLHPERIVRNRSKGD